jgi:ribosomal protein L11 methyltransferase
MIRLAVRVRRDQAELVLAELAALAPAGLEERDVDAGTVEYALYGAAGEVPDIGAVRAAAGGALVEVITSAVPDDWAERWRSFHRPVEVEGAGRRLRVRPPWEPADPAADLELVIEPGRAFGTGGHASTRLSLGLLLECPPRGALADWGCGSGVLAVAAARLGFGPVLAVDLDWAALEATPQNAAVNGVELEVRRADLRAEPAPWAPTVTANLVRGLLLEVAARLERPPDRLIAAGLLREEADEVAAAFARHGLREVARRSEAEWSALRLEHR